MENNDWIFLHHVLARRVLSVQRSCRKSKVFSYAYSEEGSWEKHHGDQSNGPHVARVPSHLACDLHVCLAFGLYLKKEKEREFG